MNNDLPATLPRRRMPHRGQVKITTTWRVMLWLLVGILATGAISTALQASIDVPDTSSPVQSNVKGNVDREATIGQSFVAKGNNLSRISVVMATEKRDQVSGINFMLRDGGPTGALLRTVRVPISALPEGELFPYNPEHPGIRDQQWQSFDFEPIPESAGRKFFFMLEDNTLVPDNRVRVALMFASGYPPGKAFINGEEQNAHVVFRAESRGQVRDYLEVIAENLTSKKQGLLANSGLYVALGTVYLLLLGATLWAAGRALRK